MTLAPDDDHERPLRWSEHPDQSEPGRLKVWPVLLLVIVLTVVIWSLVGAPLERIHREQERCAVGVTDC